MVERGRANRHGGPADRNVRLTAERCRALTGRHRCQYGLHSPRACADSSDGEQALRYAILTGVRDRFFDPVAGCPDSTADQAMLHTLQEDAVLPRFNRQRRSTAVVGLALAALTLAACGSDDDAGTQTDAGEEDVQVDQALADLSLTRSPRTAPSPSAPTRPTHRTSSSTPTARPSSGSTSTCSTPWRQARARHRVGRV